MATRGSRALAADDSTDPKQDTISASTREPKARTEPKEKPAEVVEANKQREEAQKKEEARLKEVAERDAKSTPAPATAGSPAEKAAEDIRKVEAAAKRAIEEVDAGKTPVDPETVNTGPVGGRPQSVKGPAGQKVGQTAVESGGGAIY